MRYLILLATMALGLMGGTVEFLPGKSNEFSPSRGERFEIPVMLKEPAKVSLEIYTPDGALIRKLGGERSLEKGKHLFRWDGKDREGTVVPDEAYDLVLRAENREGNVTVVDPRLNSGGVLLRNIDPKVSRSGKIVYRLEAPARVTIRLGVKGGALLRTLLEWRPKNRGKNIQIWDGYDQDHLINLRQNRKLEIALSAFTLADHAVLTTGNRTLDYFDYIHRKKLTPSMTAKQKRFEEAKEKKRFSPYYTRSLESLRNPRVLIRFPETLPRNGEGIPIVEKGKPVRVKVLLDEADAKRMAKVKYEITFFDDLEFIAEEEMGYVPISWMWQPKGEKGAHTFTVNLSSFDGHVGVKSVRYLIQ
jgi:hypothetical protein